MEKDIRDPVYVTLEQHLALDSRVTLLEQRLTRIEERLARVEGRLEELSKRMDRIEEDLREVNKRIDNVLLAIVFSFIGVVAVNILLRILGVV